MPDVGAPPLLEARIARKGYRTPTGVVEAVKSLSLAVAPNEFVCVIGPSGCGKTTTLRILLGLDRDFEGSLTPDPRSLAIGVAFQEPRLLPWRTVEQNIRLALPANKRHRDLEFLLADLGIADWRARYPGELSLGMARRASLARALANAPELLVLDEPFVSLDDRAAAEMRRIVLAVAGRDGMSVLMVTHNVREALGLADRLVLLTPRPAQTLGVLHLNEPRERRSDRWIDEQRRWLAERFPMIMD
jgi:NitT/TauT family transport system ATP-binding protein